MAFCRVERGPHTPAPCSLAIIFTRHSCFFSNSARPAAYGPAVRKNPVLSPFFLMFLAGTLLKTILGPYIGNGVAEVPCSPLCLLFFFFFMPHFL